MAALNGPLRGKAHTTAFGAVAAIAAFAAATGASAARAAPPPELSWGGRLQLAYDRFDGVHSRDGRPHDAAYLRRGSLSLRASGGSWQADIGLDLDTGGHPWLSLDEAALTWRGRSGVRLRAGRFDPDFGLEPSGSARAAVGVEASALWDLAPDAGDGSEAVGLQWRDTGPRWHASAGWFDRPGHGSVDLRGVLSDTLGGWRWHLGAAVARKHGWRGDGRIRTRLGVRGVSESDAGRRVTLAPAGDFDGSTAAVLETALQSGPWSLQGEWLRHRLAPAGIGPARVAAGWDLQLAWTATGQARRYTLDGGRFDAPRAGAGDAPVVWELYARTTRLGVAGARATRIHALGVNAYLGRRWRASVALQHASLNEPVGPDLRSGRALVTRWQWRY